MPRTLAVAKRVSLADIAEGWTDEAYALMTPLTYNEMREITSTDTTDQEAVMQATNRLVKAHFVRGKVFVLGDDSDQLQLDDMEADDIDVSIPLLNTLFAAISGVTLDPKDGLTPAVTSPTDGSSTEQPPTTDSTTTQ